jgi:hypothetical protein
MKDEANGFPIEVPHGGSVFKEKIKKGLKLRA